MKLFNLFFFMSATIFVFGQNSEDQTKKWRYEVAVGVTKHLIIIQPQDYYKEPKYFPEHGQIQSVKIRPNLNFSISDTNFNQHGFQVDFIQAKEDQEIALFKFADSYSDSRIDDGVLNDFNLTYRFIRPFNIEKVKSKNVPNYFYFGGEMALNYKNISYLYYYFDEFGGQQQNFHEYQHNVFSLLPQIPLGYKLYLKRLFLDMNVSFRLAGYTFGNYEDDYTSYYDQYDPTTGQWLSSTKKTTHYEGKYKGFSTVGSPYSIPYNFSVRIGYRLN